MANRTTANLSTVQAVVTTAFNAPELRSDFPITYTTLVRDSENFFPGYEELRQREDRLMSSVYKKRNKRNLVAGARSINVSGTKGDTNSFTPSWSTRKDFFSLSMKQAGNSLIPLPQQLNDEFIESMKNFAEGLETVASDFIFAQRTGVNDQTVGGSFDATNSAFEITASADQDRAFQITRAVMDNRNYSSGKIYADTAAYLLFTQQMNQGAGNSENLAFQFGGIEIIHSKYLNDNATGLGYTSGFWLFVPTGTVGVLPWTPPQNRGNRAGFEIIAPVEYGSIVNPITGDLQAVYIEQAASDQSATNGSAQDVVNNYEISVDHSLNVSPIDVTDEEAIHAFALV